MQCAHPLCNEISPQRTFTNPFTKSMREETRRHCDLQNQIILQFYQINIRYMPQAYGTSASIVSRIEFSLNK